MSDGDEKPGKRKYTMSDAALQQRRAAADLSTGPVSEEGKAASSRNGWKHGLRSQANQAQWREFGALFGKPCRTTCRRYPCDLVNDGITRPGGDCLDKTVYLQAFDSLLEVMQGGDQLAAHGMMAMEAAGALEMLHNLRESIHEKGLYIIKPFITKDGKTVPDPEDPEGKRVLGDLVPNPMIVLWQRLLSDLGINLPEMMATPRAQTRAKGEEETQDVFRDMMERLARAGGGQLPRRGVTMDGSVDD